MAGVAPGHFSYLIASSSVLAAEHLSPAFNESLNKVAALFAVV
jgi:hypothetical protein